jgi:hypothetical protein
MLSSDKQKTVWLLGGILRIAEGLDRRQIQNVTDIDINTKNDKIIITLKKEGEELPDIEKWGAERRKDMLEEALNRDILFKY